MAGTPNAIKTNRSAVRRFGAMPRSRFTGCIG
jgi:hypothetical protein